MLLLCYCYYYYYYHYHHHYNTTTTTTPPPPFTVTKNVFTQWLLLQLIAHIGGHACFTNSPCYKVFFCLEHNSKSTEGIYLKLEI
ncbi:hypothetical protein DPMN_102108 [Dreissena polymorpha]|uniref:Uncharacterized protein n=1 Tax=Dreissena polymorpha TaxID=45954 RepID=A0A9D4LIW0_DREPO|nr:hypothetical protein DPMN_102108 [Dreissena polymorpha]